MKDIVNFSKINSSLSLVTQSVPKKSTVVPAEQDTNHILIIDCSGSMYYELPKIREQLKNKLPTLVKEKDTVTIIWFSGRDEYGVLIEGVEFATAKDLQAANKAIDRWLRPIGATGFKQPLEEARKVVKNLLKAHPGNANSVFFLSDGYDNSWSQKDILAVCKALETEVSASTVIEYGFYCNRPLMAAMAETMGGALIFSEDFNHYEPLFEQAMKRRLMGGKKVEVTLPFQPHRDIVYAVLEGQVLTFKPENRVIRVPESTNTITYLTNETAPVGVSPKENSQGLYAGLSVYSQRMMADEVLGLLKQTGDARLIKQFANCFGKQAYSEFQKNAEEAVFNPKKMLLEGYDPNLVPDENAFTVLDALAVLMDDDENLFYPNHDAFSYSRIGRKTVQKSEMLTEEQKTTVNALMAESMKTTSKSKLAEVKAKIDEIMGSIEDSLEFTVADKSVGYPVSEMVLNESRPNVSVRVRMKGTVTLKQDRYKSIPAEFPTFVYRNYTIIRDGILNTKVIPVSLSLDAFDTLSKQGLIMDAGRYETGKVYLLNLAGVPIVNRRMVKQVSAQTLFEQSYFLEKLKARHKVLNSYLKATGTEKSKGFLELYGTEETAWLKEQGITEFSGFGPKVVQAESTDVYMGKEIDVKLKGLSALPSLADVTKAIAAKKKLTLGQQLISDAINEIEPHKSDAEWLQAAMIQNKQDTNTLRRETTEQKFSIVVGQIWPKEFNSLDDNSLNIKIDNNASLQCTINLNEIEVKI